LEGGMPLVEGGLCDGKIHQHSPELSILSPCRFSSVVLSWEPYAHQDSIMFTSTLYWFGFGFFIVGFYMYMHTLLGFEPRASHMPGKCSSTERTRVCYIHILIVFLYHVLRK
jgi:hypothetical protein